MGFTYYFDITLQLSNLCVETQVQQHLFRLEYSSVKPEGMQLASLYLHVEDQGANCKPSINSNIGCLWELGK